MGRPRFHPIRNSLAALTVAGTMLFTIASPAAAAPWQQSWGDYDTQRQWHDAKWWLQHDHQWVVSHHPEWTEDYAGTPGVIGDSDRFHVRHYGDGATDRSNLAVRNERQKGLQKAEASMKDASRS